MTRKQLIERIYELDFINTKADATRVLDKVLTIITDEVISGNEVALGQKFGTFKPAVQSARIGRNPTTGETINIPEKKIIKFRPSSVLKKTIAAS